jgi:phospholipase/carboxylesterase
MGFSQGAALLSAALLSGKLSADGVALLAGFVVEPDTTALTCRPRIFVAHGTRDDVIRVERARKGVERLRGLGLDVVYIEDDVSHKVGIEGTRALKSWLHAVIG